jgi:hypothetical protein
MTKRKKRRRMRRMRRMRWVMTDPHTGEQAIGDMPASPAI